MIRRKQLLNNILQAWGIPVLILGKDSNDHTAIDQAVAYEHFPISRGGSVYKR